MATLKFEYNTNNTPLSRIIDAICLEYYYPDQIPDTENPGQMINNPETKANFARRMIRQIIVNIVKNQDLITARTQAESSVIPINLD